MPISLAPLAEAAIGSAGQGITGLIGGLFKSKKHYHLYYWDAQSAAWIFVMDGHPSQVNPLATDYRRQGVPVALIRNKDDKAPDGTLAPKSPPAGYTAEAAGKAPGGPLPWILAGVAGVGVVVFLILRKKRR
jgi:hypothetical protein